MKPTQLWIGTALLGTALASPALAAPRPIDQHVAADASGAVEIVNVAGSVEVQGWDKPEVSVTGTLGDGVERVDLSAAGNRVSLHVVAKHSLAGWGRDGEAKLVVHVPAHSALDISLVSADLRLAGLQGDSHVQTVSGDINGETGGATLQLSTVSGDVRLTARNSRDLRLKTVSGGLFLEGPGGEVAFSTVSGNGQLTLGTLSRLRLESVSGDMHVKATLGTNGQLEATSVSGDVQVELAAAPDADFELSAFSGDIRNCFAGAAPVREKFGPGTRLNFHSGKGGGRVHVDTKSGDIAVCAPH
jgi:DUF4097 and DUF4098 domain-containing protein YvlB